MDRFLFAENPLNEGEIQKQYVIHTVKPKCIIEAVDVAEQPDVVSSGYPHQVYSYENTDAIEETWALVIRDVYDGSTVAEQGKLLDRAWRWFRSYLQFQDSAVDEQEGAQWN